MPTAACGALRLSLPRCAARVRTLDQVNTIFHANLTAARRMLAEMTAHMNAYGTRESESAMTLVVVMVSWLLVALSSAPPAAADQTRLVNYDEARRLFWARLYPQGGTTLYCGEPFVRRNPSLNIEHVYAASWMAKHLQCGSREQCRRTSPRFNHMEADLHNLHPDLEVTNAARKDYRFGESRGKLQPCARHATLSMIRASSSPSPGQPCAGTSPDPCSIWSRSMACRLTQRCAQSSYSGIRRTRRPPRSGYAMT